MRAHARLLWCGDEAHVRAGRDAVQLSAPRRRDHGADRANETSISLACRQAGRPGLSAPAGAALRTGFIAGLAFEVRDIEALAADLKERGLPVGEPHPALQGGRIVSVHASGACGVPVAFIDFSD